MYVTLIQIKAVVGKQEAQDKSLNQRMIANQSVIMYRLHRFRITHFLLKKIKDKILKECYPLSTSCSVCKCELIDIIQRKR